MCSFVRFTSVFLLPKKRSTRLSLVLWGSKTRNHVLGYRPALPPPRLASIRPSPLPRPAVPRPAPSLPVRELSGVWLRGTHFHSHKLDPCAAELEFILSAARSTFFFGIAAKYGVPFFFCASPRPAVLIPGIKKRLKPSKNVGTNLLRLICRLHSLKAPVRSGSSRATVDFLNFIIHFWAETRAH